MSLKMYVYRQHLHSEMINSYTVIEQYSIGPVVAVLYWSSSICPDSFPSNHSLLVCLAIRLWAQIVRHWLASKNLQCLVGKKKSYLTAGNQNGHQKLKDRRKAPHHHTLIYWYYQYTFELYIYLNIYNDNSIH